MNSWTINSIFWKVNNYESFLNLDLELYFGTGHFDNDDDKTMDHSCI